MSEPDKTPKTIPVTDILPPPFAWITVPGGQITLDKGGYVPEDGQTFTVEPFRIARYPITNAQYRVFVEDGGYATRDYWADAGWQKKEKGGWTGSRYWDHARFNPDDHPVVGVSWHEVIAFCRWLSARLGSSHTTPAITLPTEQQWQRAAQGDDGRTFPWGDPFDSSRCNTTESGFERTTPVTQYPQGASPYGVLDMVGNVWEWCLTGWETGNHHGAPDQVRVLRGGSFLHGANCARCMYRRYDSSFRRDRSNGFRVVCAASV